MLRLRTLGGLSLRTADGADHSLLSQPKRLGLLIYLAASNGAGFRRRDQLLSLFWPELDDDHARGALRQAMYVLRRDLGHGIVRTRGDDEIGIDPCAIWFDAAAFSAAVAADRHREAIDLYDGDFLDGYFVAGAAAEFEEWVARERQRLRASASSALWAIAKGAAASEPEAAITAIRRAIALSPDDEVALRRGLEQLAQLGDRAGALHLYQEFRERLHREYGAQPSTESKALGQALQRSSDPLPPEPFATVAAVADRSESGAVAPVTSETTTSEPRGAAVTGPPPRRSLPVRTVVTTALVACVAGVAWIARDMDVGSLTDSGQVVSTDELLVADVQAPPADSLAARAITELLRSSLASTRSIRVVTRESQDQTLRRMLLPINARLTDTVAREVATRSGYEAVLLTDLRPLGRGFVLTSRVTTVPGVELASITERAPSADALIAAVDRLARELRIRIGESRDALVDIPPLQQVTTRSLKALALFTQAQEESRIHGQQPPHVMALLREAIAADSTFAMAHRRIGAAYHNLGLTRESLAAFRAADRFSDRLPEQDRRAIRMMLYGNIRDFPRAIAEARELARLNPRHPMVLNQLPFYLFTLGQFDGIEEEMRRLGAGNGSASNGWTNNGAVNLWMYQGLGAKALEVARKQLREAHDSTWVNSTRSARNRMARVHTSMFAYDSAILYSTPRSVVDSGTPQILAASRVAKGQLISAMDVQASRVRSGDREMLVPDVRSGVESFSAMADMLISGDQASARSRMRRILADPAYVAVHPANRPIRTTLALALTGLTADARTELTKLQQGATDDVRAARALDVAYGRGAVALSEGRLTDAITEFADASTASTFASLDTCRVCALPWLGRAYDLANQPDSVVSVYERYLTTGDPFRLSSDALWRARILQRLGELHAARGDTGLATKRLAEFVAVWKDADPPLRREVARAGRQLATLRRPVPNTATTGIAAR